MDGCCKSGQAERIWIVPTQPGLAWPVGLVDLPEIQVNMYKPTLAVARTGAGTECDGDVCEDAWM